jgi:hypothetical protein
MPSGFTAPTAQPKEKGGKNKRHGSHTRGGTRREPGRYPNAISFASDSVPDSRPGGRSKTKHPGFD